MTPQACVFVAAFSNGDGTFTVFLPASDREAAPVVLVNVGGETVMVRRVTLDAAALIGAAVGIGAGIAGLPGNEFIRRLKQSNEQLQRGLRETVKPF